MDQLGNLKSGIIKRIWACDNSARRRSLTRARAFEHSSGENLFNSYIYYVYIDINSKLYCFTCEFGRILVIISFLFHVWDALADLFDCFSGFTGSAVLDLT